MPATEQEAPTLTTDSEASVPNVTVQCQAPMLPDTPPFSVRPKDSVTTVTPQKGNSRPRHPAVPTAPKHVSPCTSSVKSIQAPVQGANPNVSKATPSTASKPASSGTQTQVQKGHVKFNDKFEKVPSNDPSQIRLHHLSSAHPRARAFRGPHNSKRGRPPRHPNPGQRMTNHDPVRFHRPEDQPTPTRPAPRPSSLQGPPAARRPRVDSGKKTQRPSSNGSRRLQGQNEPQNKHLTF